ncbi:hypothetical protein Tco_1452831 [Tanacetum coccineum]
MPVGKYNGLLLVSLWRPCMKRILEETLSSSTISDLLRRYISTASTPKTTASNTQPLAASTKVVVEGDEKKEAMLMVVVGVVMVVSERVKGVVVMTWPNKRPSMSPEEVVKRWSKEASVGPEIWILSMVEKSGK